VGNQWQDITEFLETAAIMMVVSLFHITQALLQWVSLFSSDKHENKPNYSLGGHQSSSPMGVLLRDYSNH